MAVRVLPVCLVALLGLAGSPVPRIQFTDTRLKNGLRLIVSEEHAAPMFSIVVNYNVGSRDERKGRTGFRAPLRAHDVQGFRERRSRRASVPHVHERRDMNGTTNKDRTMYFESLPANQLDLALFLEADRMRSLAITKANLDNQRNAVQEERRLGVDNQPYGKTFEVLDELAYENFAYEHSVIGSMADLDAATRRGRGGVLQDVLRAQQRRDRNRRRRRRQVHNREGPEVLRGHSVAARRRRRST